MKNGAFRIPHPPGMETPEWSDVRQEEFPTELRTIPVEVKGFVSAWNLPAKYGHMRTITVDQVSFISNPVELIPADPRLKRVWISATGTNVVVGTREQVMDPQSPDGFLMPANVAMPWEGFKEPLFGVCNSAGSQKVSLRYEYWAD